MLFLGLAILWALFIWSLWEKALTEYTKNYLFDLRDGLRAWFIEKGYGLEHPSYRAAREMLDATLWHVSRASYWQYMVFKLAAKRHPEWAQERREYVNQKFVSGNQEIDAYIHAVRNRLAVAISAYIILRSYTILFVSFVACLFSLGFGALSGVWKRISPGFEDFAAPVPRLLRTALFCLIAFVFPMRAPGRVPENTMVAWSLNAKMAAAEAFNKA